MFAAIAQLNYRESFVSLSCALLCSSSQLWRRRAKCKNNRTCSNDFQRISAQIDTCYIFGAGPVATNCGYCARKITRSDLCICTHWLNFPTSEFLTKTFTRCWSRGGQDETKSTEFMCFNEWVFKEFLLKKMLRVSVVDINTSNRGSCKRGLWAMQWFIGGMHANSFLWNILWPNYEESFINCVNAIFLYFMFCQNFWGKCVK